MSQSPVEPAIPAVMMCQRREAQRSARRQSTDARQRCAAPGTVPSVDCYVEVLTAWDQKRIRSKDEVKHASQTGDLVEGTRMIVGAGSGVA
jgi:hypothetical protein